MSMNKLLISFAMLLIIQSGWGFVIDGNLDDWKKIEPVVVLDKPEQRAESPGNWQGIYDLSAKIYLAEDSDNIYITADVRDDKPLWDPRKPVIQAGWWKITYDGDALRVNITASGAITDLLLIPGAFGIKPEIYIYKSANLKSGKLVEGEIVSSYAEKYSGYILEAKLPKSILGGSMESSKFVFELYDNDGPPTSCKSLKSKAVSIPVKKK